MYKVLIWGTAIEYDQYLVAIKYYEDRKSLQVVGVTSDDHYYSYLDGYPFVPKQDLMKISFDRILICASKEKTADIRISIFACNCWGGQVYKRLGLKVRSPFYNMYELVPGYVRFLKNAKEILLHERLQFREKQYNDELSFYYPVYDLAGMELHMNNSPDPEEAERKWYERCARINWDNLFVMMYSDSEKYAEEFADPEKDLLYNEGDGHTVYVLPADRKGLSG